MVDSKVVRGVEVSRQEFESLRTRSNRTLLAAVIVAVVSGFVVHDALENADSNAQLAQMNAMNALNQANTANSMAHLAANSAEQALLQGGANPVTSLPEVPKFPPVVRSGHVTEVTGAAPASVDDTCAVTVISRNGGQNLNCQVSVRCGETTIYGGGRVGYLICGIKDGEPAFGRDDESRGDPMLELNLAGDQVIVSDGPESAYSVTISLDAL